MKAKLRKTANVLLKDCSFSEMGEPVELSPENCVAQLNTGYSIRTGTTFLKILLIKTVAKT